MSSGSQCFQPATYRIMVFDGGLGSRTMSPGSANHSIRCAISALPEQNSGVKPDGSAIMFSLSTLPATICGDRSAPATTQDIVWDSMVVSILLHSLKLQPGVKKLERFPAHGWKKNRLGRNAGRIGV